MKNKFITRKNKKNKKIKLLFLFFMFIIGLFASYKKLERSNLKINDKDFVDLIVNNAFKEDDSNIVDKLVEETYKLSNPIKLLSKDYSKYVTETIPVVKEEKVPLIYLYNSHQTEEYASSNYAEFSVHPTVIMNNYIIEDIFNKNGYKAIVEEKSIKDILNKNNWKYVKSYDASRILLEQSIIDYPSLKYFIDIHRDSLTKDKTSITIENRDYAKILFLIGLDNPNYQKNLNLTEKINNKLEEYYPNLSKGIYKKGGAGVNGIYNQDFSENTILVEIGGVDNTTTEILNSSIAFAKCFLEVINEENN